MKNKLIAALFLSLISASLIVESAKSAAAGPDDYDRFQHQSPARQSGPAARFQSLVSQGSSALKAKQYDLAISRFTAALQMNPAKNAAVVLYDLRGIAESKSGRQERAIADYDRALRVDPNYAAAYMNRAIAYEKMGNLERAMADFDHAIRRNPGVKYGRYNRGRLHSLSGRFDKAIPDLTEAIRQGGDGAADAYAMRADAYHELGNLAGAAADWDRAIRLAARNAYGYRTRGVAFFAKGDYPAAASNYANAKRMAPNDDIILNNVAWFKATCPDGSFRNGAAAIQESRKACEIAKWKDADHLDTLAVAYAETGEFDNAIRYETQALNTKGVPNGTRKKMQKHLRVFQQHKPWREEPKVPKKGT